MRKQKIYVFDKNAYLLGSDKDGIKYYLEEATFDCGWYWGIGYIETYTNNNYPERSTDISSHQHFDSLIFDKNNSAFDNFKKVFVNNPFTDKEVWLILELMQSLYDLRVYSDMLYSGGAHYTANPLADTIKNVQEYERINKVVIPALLKKLYTILEEEGN